MNEVISQIKVNKDLADSVSFKIIDYLKIFYGNCEIVACNLRLRYRDAVNRLQPNIAVLLCYSLGWISGIPMLFLKREDSLIRFHARQSIIIFGILTIQIVGLNMVSTDNNILFLFLFIWYWIIIAFTAFLWLFFMFKAYRHQDYDLSVFRNIVSKLSSIKTEKLPNYNKVPEPTLKVSNIVDTTAAITEFPNPERQIQQDADNLRCMLNEAVKSMVILCETRDPHTSSHQQQVSKLACAIAREMSLSEDQIEGIRIMGIIHDIGKVAVPAEILSKPGRLNSYEFSIIKTHPQVAYTVTLDLQFLL